jgi:glutaredoxin
MFVMGSYGKKMEECKRLAREEEERTVPFIFVLDEERSGSRTREKTNKTSLKL